MIANVCACAQGCTPTFQAGAGELLDLPEAIRSRTPSWSTSATAMSRKANSDSDRLYNPN